jgi:hypothetical protein
MFGQGESRIRTGARLDNDPTAQLSSTARSSRATNAACFAS